MVINFGIYFNIYCQFIKEYCLFILAESENDYIFISIKIINTLKSFKIPQKHRKMRLNRLNAYYEIHRFLPTFFAKLIKSKFAFYLIENKVVIIV